MRIHEVEQLEFLFTINDDLDLKKFVIYTLIGLAAGFVRELVANDNVIILPRRWKNEESNKAGLDLGIVGAMICSWFVAILVNRNYVSAGLAAIAGPHIIESIIKRISAQLKVLGGDDEKVGK